MLRIQEEEPEFYRDMLELDAMAPDLPRGAVDWETLEKLEDDPIEWQRYDARREELEEKIARLDAIEPADEESEEYDDWADQHEDLEDLLDEVEDRLDELQE